MGIIHFHTSLKWHIMLFKIAIKKHKKDFDTLKRFQEETYESHVCTGQIPHKKNTNYYKMSDDGGSWDAEN